MQKLHAQSNTGKDTSRAGFLPSVVNAMDDRDGGNYGDDPENLGHAIEDTADDEQHEALGTLHKTNFAKRDQGFGAGAGVTDHHGASGGDGGEDNVGSAAANGIINEQPHVQGHVGVAVEGGIVEGAESGNAILPAGDLTIEHIQKSREENDEGPGAEFSNREACGGGEIDEQAKKSKQIGINAGGGERIDDSLQQPFRACTNRSGESIHFCARKK